MPSPQTADSTDMVAASTLAQALREVGHAFQAAGVECAARDARLLVLAAAGLSRERALRAPDQALDTAQRRQIRLFLERRCAREPVSRILGRRDFFGRTFELTPDTLDPRPDSETLITCVLDYVAKSALQHAPLRIIDVGTGTGILVLTLLAELPSATGLGTDMSPAALSVAKRNADRHGLSGRVGFQCQDGLDEVAGPFDILVSNPPYIAHDSIAELAPEVRDFDPHLALDGGADGLEFYRALAPHVARVIPNGLAVFEVGYDQCDDVVDILKASCERHGGVLFTVKEDLAGHRRCVALQTQS